MIEVVAKTPVTAFSFNISFHDLIPGPSPFRRRELEMLNSQTLSTAKAPPLLKGEGDLRG